jgi:two-component system, cell cycle response regulator DivK
MSSIQRVKKRNGDDSRDQRRPLVVLAEDDDDTRRVYGLILRHYGYDVADAMNGHDAVTAARSLRPDLVLMDIGLPGLDGWQASRILKSDPETGGIPIVAFSARISSTDDLVGQAGTFDGFILKPISPGVLVKRVDAYLQMLGTPPPVD